MEFYISWSRSDPKYWIYFSNTNVLISPSNLNTTNNINSWSKKPNKIIVDSGAYHYLSKDKKLPLQKSIFLKQLKLIKNIKKSALICHLDHPINPKNSNQSNTYLAIEKTLSNAYEFISLFHKYGLDKNKNINPLGVIQGDSKSSIQFCAQELKKLGFKNFGLGSLAPLYDPKEIIDRITYTTKIVSGDNLHIFGISRLDIIEKLNQQNIKSIDSSRPIMAAIYKGIFYSNPFRTYGIHYANNKEKYAQTLKKPLNCNCPVCRTNPYLLLKLKGGEPVNARALHNYYHLMKHLNKEKVIQIISEYKAN